MKAFEHGGNVHCPREAGEWLDFSANINPLGLAKSIEDVLHSSIKELVHYPDPAGIALKEAISKYYCVDKEKVILGNGAVELLYLLFHSIGSCRVLIPVPSFSEYERAALAAGCHIDYLYLDETDGFKLDFSKLVELAPDYDVILLGNPNNPTGGLLEKDEIEAFLKAAEGSDTLLVMDESFLDFLDDSQRYSAKSLLDTWSNLFIIHSLTKFYAIPGLRLGFGVGKTELIERLDMAKDPWNVNLLAQKAGVAALADREYQDNSRSHLSECREEFLKLLSSIPCIKVYDGAVNFVLVNIKASGLSSGILTSRMREKGILIRDCSNYPGLDDGFVRFAIRNREENTLLLQALKTVLGC